MTRALWDRAQALRGRAQALLGDLLTVRALVGLLTTRAAVRGTLALAPLAVRAAWSEPEFAAYAGAMARFVFVVPLLSGGVEKSVLKLLPRARRSAPALIAIYLALLAALVTGVAGWVGISASAASPARLILLAGAFATLLGVNQVLVAMHRALHRIWVDLLDQLVVFAVLCAGLGAVVWLGLPPEGLLAGWVAALGLVDTVLAAPLARATSLRVPLRRRLAGFVGRDVALQGATDVITGVSITLVYTAVAFTAPPGALSQLYVVLSLATVLTTGCTYLMRVLQPSVAVWLRARRGRLAASALWHSRTIGLAAIYSLGVLLAGRVLVQGQPEPTATWWLAAVFIAYAPLLTAVAGLHFVFENRDARSLRTTVWGALTGLVAVSVLVMPLSAWAGSVGALAAVVAGDLAHLAVLVRSLGPRSRGSAPTLAPVR